MENKEFRNALVAAIKNELKDFTQVQRNLKKSRKLQYRPKDRSLQDIVDEINNNASKISTLLFYYRWIRHGLKYWANRNIYSLKDFMIKTSHEEQYWDSNYKHWDEEIKYGSNAGKTHGQLGIEYAKNYYIKKCNEYGIEVSEANANYLISNN